MVDSGIFGFLGGYNKMSFKLAIQFILVFMFNVFTAFEVSAASQPVQTSESCTYDVEFLAAAFSRYLEQLDKPNVRLTHDDILTILKYAEFINNDRACCSEKLDEIAVSVLVIHYKRVLYYEFKKRILSPRTYYSKDLVEWLDCLNDKIVPILMELHHDLGFLLLDEINRVRYAWQLFDLLNVYNQVVSNNTPLTEANTATLKDYEEKLRSQYFCSAIEEEVKLRFDGIKNAWQLLELFNVYKQIVLNNKPLTEANAAILKDYEERLRSQYFCPAIEEEVTLRIDQIRQRLRNGIVGAQLSSFSQKRPFSQTA